MHFNQSGRKIIFIPILFAGIWGVGPGLRGEIDTPLVGNPDHWLAIVGDSGVTGAASSPDLDPRIESLLAEILRLKSESAEESPPLTRIASGNHWAQKIDRPTNSFGYLVGRGLGVKPNDIVLVGEDGTTISTLPEQMQRIYKMRTPTLPPIVLVSFTANDLCDEKIFSQSEEITVNQFKKNMNLAWAQAKPFLRAHKTGTRIVVLAPLDVVNVITNPDILAQKVNVEGRGQVTCGEVHQASNNFDLSTLIIARMLNRLCPSVTETSRGQRDRIYRLRSLQRQYGEVWVNQLKVLSARYASEGLRFEYIEGTRTLNFTTGDVANDCFHPSKQGHRKIADLVSRSINEVSASQGFGTSF
jgi:lysophospholipase L1-like esterase